jgi:Tfp pilus assembly protein PilN
MELLTHKKTASIDLLKDEEKVKSSSQRKLVVTLCVIVLLAIAMVSFGLFAFNLAQKIRLNNVKEEVNSKITAWQALEPVGTSLKTISAKNQVITTTNSKYAGLEKRLDKIRGLLPSGTSLTTLTIAHDGKAVLSGNSSEADSIYQFYELLKKESDITNPTLTSLAKSSTDYTFNISLTLTTK